MNASIRRNTNFDPNPATVANVYGKMHVDPDTPFQWHLPLSKFAFLEQLRREERRANRSNGHLSIALIRLDNESASDLRSSMAILKRLQNSVRETDILGCLDKEVFGVILPDTDENRTQDFKNRIVNGHKNPPFTIITGTYPGMLFQNLLTEDQARSELYPLFMEDPQKCKGFAYLLKRSLDILGAVVGILLFSPLMLIAALAIKITSPGPIIFRQMRLGQRGVPFVFYKFRSMFANTDERIHREYVSHLIEGNLDHINQGDKEKPLYKMKSDPRITRVGRIIRKTSIDELPQLFNVLKGDMSLVGPRPPLPYEVEKYQAWHLARILEIKPGITGLWQVEGRSATSFDDMVRLDIRYIRNWSLMLDLKILLKTVRVVLQSAGAV